MYFLDISCLGMQRPVDGNAGLVLFICRVIFVINFSIILFKCLVKKCFVTDGDGEEHIVINEDGCTADSSLLDDIVYHDSLMRAHAQSQVSHSTTKNNINKSKHLGIQICRQQSTLFYLPNPFMSKTNGYV